MPPETDRILALERKAEVYLQGGERDHGSMSFLQEIRAGIKEIRDEQVAIRIEMTRGNAKFEAIELWQQQHDASHAERRADLKSVVMPLIGHLLMLALAGGMGYYAATTAPTKAAPPQERIP